MEQFNISLNTRFITLDEFKEYTGIDLAVQMKDDDNPSNTAEAFLLRNTERLEAYLESEYFRSPDREFSHMTNYQKYHYKIALIEQSLYIFKNGDISVDSGYEPESGVKASSGYLSDITLSNNAKRELMLCGLLSRKMRGGRGFGGYGDGWLY